MLPLANAVVNKGREIVFSIEKIFRRCGKRRVIVKYEDACKKLVRIRNDFSQNTQLTDAFKKTYGFFGEVVADALPLFALDLVGIIARYATVRGDEVSLSLRTEIEKIGSKNLVTLSSEVESRLEIDGPFISDLDLSFDKKPSLFIDVDFLRRYLLTNVTALQSLKISCTVQAADVLNLFPNLQKLEITSLGRHKGNREGPDARAGVLLDQYEVQQIFDQLEENEDIYTPITGNTLDKVLKKLSRQFSHLSLTLPSTKV